MAGQINPALIAALMQRMGLGAPGAPGAGGMPGMPGMAGMMGGGAMPPGMGDAGGGMAGPGPGNAPLPNMMLDGYHGETTGAGVDLRRGMPMGELGVDLTGAGKGGTDLDDASGVSPSLRAASMRRGAMSKKDKGGKGKKGGHGGMSM